MKVHPLMYPFLGLFFVSGLLGEFVILLFFVTIHELAHVVVGVLFGAEFSQILITPVGERAIIKNMELLSYRKRLLVAFAGPCISLFFGLFFLVFFPHTDFFCFLSLSNFIIGFFNLLPFLPMDGGNILLFYFGKRIGTLSTAEILTKFSKGFGYFLIIVGIFQVIFYPFNISLLLIGFYFRHSNKREYLNITFRFYKGILYFKNGCSKGKNLEVKRLMIYEKEHLGNILKKISTDYYYIFCFVQENEIREFSQSEVMELLLAKGSTAEIGSC